MVNALSIAELLSALTCLWSIWLNTGRKTLGWPIGLFSVLLAAVVYYHAGLLAECGLQAFYFLSGLYGWWQWNHAEKTGESDQIQIEFLSWREAAAGLLVSLLASIILYLLLLQIPRASNPLPDALLTSFSLLAQFWLARRKLENWLLWMGINSGSVILYFQRELWFFAALYFLLLLLAFRGYGSWKKSRLIC